MAEKHIISGSVIDDAHPIAVEQQGEVVVQDGLEVEVTALPAITGAVTADVLGTPGLTASREGRAFCRKVNAKSGIHGAATVLTDADLLQTTEAGYRDVIAGFYVHIDTDSDWCKFEIVVTANADGSGAVTVLTPMFRMESPVARDEASPHQSQVYPPLVITPAMGGAWTIRAQTNDAAAEVTIALNGWREPIPA